MSESRLLIYNASAGSGKTFQIVKNFLREIIQNNNNYHISKLIGLTFTNETAKEMKFRIMNTLLKASKGDYDVEMKILFKESRTIIEKQLKNKLSDKEYQDEFKKRIEKRLQEILHQYDDFNLLTIDKFFVRIVKTFAREMNIPYDANIILNPNEIIDNLIDEIISDTTPDKPLMKNFIELAIDNAENEKDWDIKNNLKEIINVIFDDNQKEHISYIKTKKTEDFVRLKQKLNNQRKEIRDKFFEFQKQGKKIIKGYESFLNVTNFIQKLDKDTSIKNLFTPTLIGKITEEKENYYYIKNKIKNLSYKEQEYVKTSLNKEIHNYLNSVYNYYKEKHQQYILISGLLEEVNSLLILHALINKIDEFKEITHSVFLQDFPHLIKHQILRNIEAETPYIYMRLGEKYAHYFLDEFQDTSELQWENMIPLIKESLSKDFSYNFNIDNPGTAMIVGDAKQSIYRFRNGKPEIFIDLSNPELINNTGNPFSEVTGKKIENLEFNWRSDGNIISFNNKFFTINKTNLKEAKYNRVYKYVEQKVPIKREKIKNKGYVELRFIHKITGENNELPQSVYNIIKDSLKRNYCLEDICFIFNSHNQSIPVAEYLNENNIPVLSGRSLLINKSHKVNFVINMLKFISFSTKTNLFDALYFIFKDNQINNLEDKINEILELKTSKQIFEKLKEYGFDTKYETILKLNIYDLSIYLIDKFNLTNNNKEENYLQTLLDDIHNFMMESKAGITEYLHHFKEIEEDLSVKSANTKGAVRFMTIHGSKGLEFPIVIFFGNMEILGSKDKESIVWIKTDANKYEGFEYLPVKLKHLENINKYQNDYFSMIEEKKFDNYNKLYVAHTRAQNEFYIISPLPPKNETKGIHVKQLYGEFIKNDKNINKIEQNDVYTYGNKDNNITKKQDKNYNKFKAKFHLKYWGESEDNRLKIKTQSYEFWQSDKKNAIKYGLQIHEILAKIKSKTDWKKNKGKYLAKISEKNKKSVHRTIEKVIFHPELKNFFENNYLHLNERALLIPDNIKPFRIKRPDKIIIKNDTAVIIDYKTGEKQRKHHKQINEYANILEKIGYKIIDKILVYINRDIEIEKL